jgi:hypothetical protein
MYLTRYWHINLVTCTRRVIRAFVEMRLCLIILLCLHFKMGNFSKNFNKPFRNITKNLILLKT